MIIKKIVRLSLFNLLFVLLLSQQGYAVSLSGLTQKNALHPGFVPFIYDKNTGKTYLLLKNLNQQFLYQSGLTQGLGSNDIGLDRGQLGETRLVTLVDGGSKILLKQLNTRYRAISSNVQEAQSVEQAFANSVIWGFPVIERNRQGILVDASDFLINDIHGIARRLSTMKEGDFRVDKSRSAFYAQNSKSFPLNTELEATVTFTGSKPGKFLRSVAPDPYSFSVRFHHTFAQLPDSDFQPREYHPQSGFFPVDYLDYATPIEKNLQKRFITRHRLKKIHPEQKVSEAVKPIIYYVDAGAPEPVRSALIEGAGWWNQAFEAIGYKNAFQVKVLPAEADPMDLRYNVIQWVHRSTRGWSYGASVVDPRTGEIIKGHVSLGSLRVRQDYLIAQALLSPFTEKNQTESTAVMTAMALARIRQLAAHEVGHTLGLAHNFSASVDDRASVMDYPQPKVILKNKQLDFSDAYDVGIGAWDRQTIAYGYTDLTLSDNPHQRLLSIVSSSKTKGLHYLSDPDARALSTPAPDANLWDNGKDAMKELERLIKIRTYSLARFGSNSIPVGTPYSSLEEVLVPLYFYARYQIIAVGKSIGGYYYDYSVKSRSEDNKLNDFKVSMANGTQQKEAIYSLLKTLTPDYLMLPAKVRTLIPPKAYGYEKSRESTQGYTGITFDELSLAEASANHTLRVLLNPERLNRLQQQHGIEAEIPGSAFIFKQLLNLTKNSGRGIGAEIQKRVNYRIVQQLMKTYNNKQLAPEVKPLILAALIEYKNWMKWTLWLTSKTNDWYAFYSHSILQIDHFIAQPEKVQPDQAIPMPPGSPI
ncbi:MAG TPA: DUF5117 domain-containing protein [Aeromonadales bacterium]|nr:DUF5117 domain-containing protein [Aeromonadales bacterium]